MDSYVLFKKGEQNKLLEELINRFGSERKLSKVSNIPYQTLNVYRNEKVNIPKSRFLIFLKLLNLDISHFDSKIVRYLDKDWGRRKGGNKLIEIKKRDGNYEQYIEYLRRRGSKIFSNWHKNLRKSNEREYFKIQHNRFRKSLKSLSNRNFITDKGEKVRNILEKETADFLNSLNIKYEYEPYLRIGNHSYFPDFRINNLIIECTYWRGSMKIDKLKRKFKDYENEGYNCMLIVKQGIEKFYKCFKDKLFVLNQASVAQTILELSK